MKRANDATGQNLLIRKLNRIFVFDILRSTANVAVYSQYSVPLSSILTIRRKTKVLDYVYCTRRCSPSSFNLASTVANDHNEIVYLKTKLPVLASLQHSNQIKSNIFDNTNKSKINKQVPNEKQPVLWI